MKITRLGVNRGITEEVKRLAIEIDGVIYRLEESVDGGLIINAIDDKDGRVLSRLKVFPSACNLIELKME